MPTASEGGNGMTSPAQSEVIHPDFAIGKSPSPEMDMSSPSTAHTQQRSSGDLATCNHSDRKCSSGDSAISNDSGRHCRKRSSDDSATGNDSNRYQDMRIPQKSGHRSQNIHRAPVPSSRQPQRQRPAQPALRRQEVILLQLNQQIEQEKYHVNKAAIFAKQQELALMCRDKMHYWRTGEMYNRQRARVQVQTDIACTIGSLNPLEKRSRKRRRDFMNRQIQNMRQMHKRRKF